MLNVFGSIDNLAWIWVSEKNVRDKRGRELSRLKVGLSKKCEDVRASLPQDLRDYLATMDLWFDQMEDYRHALAHRIPLYIPPYQVSESNVDQYKALDAQMSDAIKQYRFEEYERLSAEQAKLCVFRPVMSHSFDEQSKPLVLHAQMLADFKTVEEVAKRLLRAV